MIQKIDIVFGTRPEAIKMAMVCRALMAVPGLSVRVISTGQHKEMLASVLTWFELVPDADLELMQPNQSLSGLTSRCIARLQDYYDTHGKPDLVLVQGDTTTAFAAGLVAFYNKVLLGHVEAGLRTFNKHSPWPEEINRTLLTRISDIHFAPTSENREALLREGVGEKSVFQTGNTVIDALLFSRDKVKALDIYPAELADFFIGDRKDRRMVLITGHRRENFGDGFRSICNSIKTLAYAHPQVDFVYPVHLNPNVQGIVMMQLGGLANVHLVSPLGYADFVSLMNRSSVILTDSGGIQEEGPSLGKPVLVMRDNTERPEALKCGTVKLVGTDEKKIFDEVSWLLTDEHYYALMTKATNPYGDGTSAQQIAQIIRSFQYAGNNLDQKAC